MSILTPQKSIFLYCDDDLVSMDRYGIDISAFQIKEVMQFPYGNSLYQLDLKSSM